MLKLGIPAIAIWIVILVASNTYGNSYYTHGSYPTTGSAATSAGLRAEFDAITTGFNLLPPLGGNANTAVVVNGGGTGLTTTTGQLSLAGNFTLSGAFATTLTVTGATTVTLPTAGTLSTLAGTESLSNKTLVAPVLSGTVTGTYTFGGTPTISSPTITGTVGGSATYSSPTFTGTVNGTPTWASAQTLPGMTLSTTPLAPGSGGTGTSIAPTNGQLLIGNGSGYTLASLTPVGTGTGITNGAGSITVVAEGFSTGDVKLTIKTVADAGWVLMNDGSIGNASSGATTRANADTSALFTLVWNNCANADCPVSSGRGASAAADFAANKTLTLPKSLGRALATAGSGAGLTARTLGNALGAEDAIVVSHTHTVTDSGHSHGLSFSVGNTGSNPPYVAAGADGSAGSRSFTSTTATTGISIASAGSSGTGANMQPTLFLTVMIKL